MPQPGLIPNTGSSQTPEAESNLANTKWMLMSFGQPGAETPVIVGSSTTIEFDSQGQAGGSGGCNSYDTTYEVQDNMISFGEITRTLMACQQGGIGEQEGRYFQALESASTFELAGDRLTIWYGDQGNTLNFVAATSATPTVPPTVPPAPTPTAGRGSSMERVEFQPGAISATRSGVLPEGGVKEYVLWTLTGHTMHVQTVDWSAPVEFTLRSLGGEIWSGELQPSDAYIFTV
jgi:heat shock protein HslJ